MVGFTSGVWKDNFDSVNDGNWLEFRIAIDATKKIMETISQMIDLLNVKYLCEQVGHLWDLGEEHFGQLNV